MGKGKICYDGDLSCYSDYIENRLNEINKSKSLENISSKIIIDIFPFPAQYFPLHAEIYREEYDHLILLDIIHLENRHFNTGEICSIILHEIGHILNYPDKENVPIEIEEYYADDFVRLLGFERELLSGYEKLIQYNNETGKINELLNKKIKRIKNGDKINIGIERNITN